MSSRLCRWLCLLTMAAMVVACSPKIQGHDAEMPRPTWPEAPLEPKIVWVKDISLIGKNAAPTGFWGRVKDFFVGHEIQQLRRPYGVATDYETRLFIADTGASRVYVYDMESDSYFSITGEADLSVKSPIGLAYAGDDKLYISDSVSRRVLRYDLKAGEMDIFTPYKFQRPTGIAYSWRTRQLFVVDTKAHQVVVLNQAGLEQFRFGGHGDGQGKFNFPTDIWVDLQGQVYVTDALNSRIQIFSLEGRFISSFGQPGDTLGSFAKPKGVTADAAGHIYVCDALFDAVQIFSQDGKLLMVFGDNGHKPGQFWMPSGIFADRRGYIYVTDTYNRRIQVFRHVNCSLNHDCSK